MPDLKAIQERIKNNKQTKELPPLKKRGQEQLAVSKLNKEYKTLLSEPQKK